MAKRYSSSFFIYLQLARAIANFHILAARQTHVRWQPTWKNENGPQTRHTSFALDAKNIHAMPRLDSFLFDGGFVCSKRTHCDLRPFHAKLRHHVWRGHEHRGWTNVLALPWGRHMRWLGCGLAGQQQRHQPRRGQPDQHHQRQQVPKRSRHARFARGVGA